MDWVERVCRVRQWRQDGRRAPHKPLLLLYALGHFQREGDAPIRFRDAEEQLQLLLTEFGPPRRSTMAYPFFHLRTDGLWQVTGARIEPSAAALRDGDAAGRLASDLVRALRDDSTLVVRLARAILETNFESSLHPDICQVAGLRLDPAGEVAPLPVPMPARDPEFRERVLIAYEYRCAFCGFDGALGRSPVGLEAAHVRWWSEGGPDETANGLALCSLHHKLLDLGVLGIGADLTVAVSDRFVGRSRMARAIVHDLSGQAVLRPQRGHPPVRADHIAWHAREVFKGRTRPAA
ncbi:phosphorothioated DNA-binding restriction endonuclease [Nonomuraea cavernae]|uniref:phosphorothioated DNA-binding restriction endonuclease n=1 Tax=Nonomuraea cavernae TaxID=2045107 RepID=UPI00166752E4|nr:HNH endonuclease [Nonomuraea cavernae]